MIENYSQLPLGRYIDITSVLSDDTLGEVDRQVRVLAILSGRTEDDLLNAPITDYADLARRAQFLDKAPEVTAEAKDVYELGAFRLVPVKDARKMTAAQYIDFQTFGRNAKDNIVEMLSCLLVPEGMRYNDGYDVLEVQSTGIEVLRNVLRQLSEQGITADSWTFDTFNQRFADECAGVFCGVTLYAPVGWTCADYFDKDNTKLIF